MIHIENINLKSERDIALKCLEDVIVLLENMDDIKCFEMTKDSIGLTSLDKHDSYEQINIKISFK